MLHEVIKRLPNRVYLDDLIFEIRLLEMRAPTDAAI